MDYCAGAHSCQHYCQVAQAELLEAAPQARHSSSVQRGCPEKGGAAAGRFQLPELLLGVGLAALIRTDRKAKPAAGKIFRILQVIIPGESREFSGFQPKP